MVIDMLTKICETINLPSHVVWSGGNNIACYSTKIETGFQKRRLVGTKIHGVTYHKTVFTVTAF